MSFAKYLGKAAVVVCAAVLMLAIQCSHTLAADVFVKPSIAKAGKLRMGNTLSYAPFEFRDEQNQPTGIDIELANAASKLLNVELEIVEIPWVNSLPALASGRTDISWATYTVREDRLAQVDFVVYMETGSVVSTTPDKAASLPDQYALCGKKMAIQAGGSADFTADKLSDACTSRGLEAIKKHVYPEVAPVIQAVLSGRADCRLDDSTASGYYEVTSGGKLVVVPGMYDNSPCGIAVPKGDKEMAEMVRSVLQAMIDNGTYKKIFDKYGMGASTIPKAYVVTKIDDIK